MFRKLELKDNYTSEEDNLYTDFFKPTLSEAVTYKRAVGFFSLGVLLNTPAAMTQIVMGKGRIELIFGKLVAPEDFEAIQEGSQQPWSEGELPNFSELIEQRNGGLLDFRIRLLAWLFQSGCLEMKVAVRPRGMFHQKIGLLEDSYGDVVSFSGSMNETISALDPRFNSEEITVFRSWRDGQKAYVNNHKKNFAKLWSGETGSSTVVCSIPEAIEEGLSFVAEQISEQPTPDVEDQRVQAFFEKRGQVGTSKPTVPKNLGGNTFAMRPHQIEALREWSVNDCNGILELATGAGKTITAIYSATKIAEENEGIALVVAVPYQDLADQWVEELRIFNIHAVRCYGARKNWEPIVKQYLRRNVGEQREFVAIVVVNKTLKTDHFQSFVNQLDPERLFFIGDECHHHGGKSFEGRLFPGARFRMGLSATPFHYMDEDVNQRLRGVYDRSVYQYTLTDAVNDKVLTPYEYVPIPVELTVQEADEYLKLSDQIARAYAAKKGSESEPANERVKSLLMRRARLVGAAENKLTALAQLIQQHEVRPHTLFYCSDGRTTISDDGEDIKYAADPIEMKQRYAVAQLLMQKGIKVSPFTADENRGQRREILRRFKEGETTAMVAIKCLDEGIDVPACQTAYLIASSRNPRQFIQRRGRILRRAPGKEKATIFDFVVVMPEGSNANLSNQADFLRNELERVADFAGNSLYPASSIAPLIPWLQKYHLEHLAI